MLLTAPDPMITEKKIKLSVYVTQSDADALNALGGCAGNMTANGLSSVVLSEFARVGQNSAAVWQALARIAEEAAIEKKKIRPPSANREIAETRSMSDGVMSR